MTIKALNEEILCFDENNRCYISCKNPIAIIDVEELTKNLKICKHCDYITIYKHSNLIKIFLIEMKCTTPQSLIERSNNLTRQLKEKYITCKELINTLIGALNKFVKDKNVKVTYYAVLVLQSRHGYQTLMKLLKPIFMLGLIVCILVSSSHPLGCQEYYK